MRAGIHFRKATAPMVVALTVFAWLVVSAAPAFAAAPTISSFSPTSGPIGTVVTITGNNFNKPPDTQLVTQVKIGNKSESFTINNNMQVTATVASGTQSGLVQVTNADGTITSSALVPANFTVTAAPLPTVTSFSPTSGPVGTVVTITGTGLTGASSVKFNGTAATTFTVNSATQITATVPTGATTGKISVTTAGGTATSSTDFIVTGVLTITSFVPISGPVGTSVVITGTNFIGATAVRFKNTSATTFTVNSATQITAVVPSGATTGAISVTTPAGTATSATNFTVTAAGSPTITSFSPTSGAVGSSVVLTGTNFTGTTSVKFNGTTATFTVNSSTQITTTVPPGATTGPITVTNPNGTGTSPTNFTVMATAVPTITSFSPRIGPWGIQVVISGGNLTGATSVKFNGAAATFSVNSGTQITATVPNGATTGPVSVTTSNGTGTSADPFTVKHLRSVSLSLSGKLRAAGTVGVSDGTTACASAVPVKIQHRVNGHWRTVGTGTTTGTGSYSIHITNGSGKYRARATRTAISNGDVCGKAKSGVVFH